jgi:hypothetical protein
MRDYIDTLCRRDPLTGHMIADKTTYSAGPMIRDHYDVLCRATNRVF